MQIFQGFLPLKEHLVAFLIETWVVTSRKNVPEYYHSKLIRNTYSTLVVLVQFWVTEKPQKC